MRKSNSIFLIMSIVYILVLVLNKMAILYIDNSILVGLSLSALMMSLSDALSNIALFLSQNNEMGFIVHTTVQFLNDKIDKCAFICNPNINIRNIKTHINHMVPRHLSTVHPNLYVNKWFLKLLYVLAFGCFISSVAIFILFPYFIIKDIKIDSVPITLLAFSAMCFNVFLGELTEGKAQEKNSFLNKEQAIIQSAYVDYTYYLNYHLYCYEDYLASKSLQELLANENQKKP